MRIDIELNKDIKFPPNWQKRRRTKLDWEIVSAGIGREGISCEEREIER